VIDGGKAIRPALKATFGERVLIARCRHHKRRNVLDHLPEEQRNFIDRKLDRAWREADPECAEQELRGAPEAAPNRSSRRRRQSP
jgi:putative transposase